MVVLRYSTFQCLQQSKLLLLYLVAPSVPIALSFLVVDELPDLSLLILLNYSDVKLLVAPTAQDLSHWSFHHLCHSTPNPRLTTPDL